MTQKETNELGYFKQMPQNQFLTGQGKNIYELYLYIKCTNIL